MQRLRADASFGYNDLAGNTAIRYNSFSPKAMSKAWLKRLRVTRQKTAKKKPPKMAAFKLK
jgi:hypothetical protein